ncbi:MAG: hypothetical protein JNK48_05695 [Bryobacterales bacterium]|nr:hypothetical protein [Bryobacterales bacterium]
MRRQFLLQMLASLCAAAQKKGKQSKAGDVRILEASCVRIEGEVSVDGKLVVESRRAVPRLHLFLDFINADRQVLTTKRGMVTEETLEAGDESEFHMRVTTPPGSVTFAIRAEDGEGRDLRVENPGPFDIE